MDVLKTMVLIIVAISFSLLMYYLTSNLWFFHREEKVSGSKDVIISEIVRKIHDCYQKNLNVKYSVICYRFSLSSNEDIYASEIISKINTNIVPVNNVFPEDLHSNSKVIIRFENGNIFVEEEKYESISS